MSYPTISVITPCYNGAKYLRQTIESVLAQTYPPLEMIVVDDGSTDDSAKIAEAYAPAVTVLRQSNAGPAAARNAGLVQARGEYIHFLDADDLVAPDAYAHVAHAIKLHNYDVLVGPWIPFRASPPLYGKPYRPSLDSLLPDVIQAPPGPPCSILHRTSLARAVGGFCTELRFAEDWDFWIHLGLLRPSLGSLEQPIAYYRLHDSQLTATTHACDIARAHITGMTRLIHALVAAPSVDPDWVRASFWWAWTWIDRATRVGVTRHELQTLYDALELFVRASGGALSQSPLATLIRWVGARNAARIRAFLCCTRDDRWDGCPPPEIRPLGPLDAPTSMTL